MMPGMNPRMMKQAMKKMGMQQEDIDAARVIIETQEKRYVFEQPQVAKVNAMGQTSWQVTGEPREEAIDTAPQISAEDVQTVMEQAGVSEEEAKKAIETAGGDLAAAIIALQDD